MATQFDVKSRQTALDLDAQDNLSSTREEFMFPQHELEDGSKRPVIYFCGNSLGLQPVQLRKYILEELDAWEQYGVEGHFSGKRPWLSTDEMDGAVDVMADIVGAQRSEVAIMNSLSVNLHLMMVPFYSPTPERNMILYEKGLFPSDSFAIQSQIEFHGYKFEDCILPVAPREGRHTLETEDILETIRQNSSKIALVLLGGIQFFTGQLLDIPTITKEAHKYGINVGWDLAHAVGNVPLKLHDWDADFAVWCTYKYLNSGPGNIGGCFIHQRHHNNKDLKRFAGWWGHDKQTRFDMKEGAEFNPIPGANGYRLSNAPVLNVAALRSSLNIFKQVGMDKIRQKSLLLTGYLEQLLNEYLKDEIEIITPSDPAQRGAQLSLFFRKTASCNVNERLKKRGVVVDVRRGVSIRVAPAPLYSTFADVWDFVQILKEVLLIISPPSSSPPSSPSLPCPLSPN